ncbi:MAG TPA: hypothetical protein VFA34_13705 [Actinomycetota bacterium]|nr:hypothetical protein [Actinomycetota bacterium]
MSFAWIFRDTPKSISGRSEEFDSQQAAEDWMGAQWQRLLAEGHLAATLVDGSEELYTMKLTAD